MTMIDLSTVRRCPERCHAEVTRRGESQPCDKPAVAAQTHPESGDAAYPVCAYHTRGEGMVPLAVLLADDGDTDHLGTTRWFGASWGAPVCDPRTHIATPVGHCIHCGDPIGRSDQGLTLPYATDGTTVLYHYRCFMAEIRFNTS